MAERNGVSIDWGGFGDVMNRAAGNLANTQKLMANIGQAMKGHSKRRFAAGTGPDGEPWAELKKARKRGAKGRAKPLVDTGRLRDSISVSATPFEVHVGSNLAYARIHQLGGGADKPELAARPYLGVNEEDAEEITALVEEFMAGAFT